MGDAAARVGDKHWCHVLKSDQGAGPILPPGAATVLIGGIPAAHLGDLARCIGPSDVIAGGASTVLIEGLPAARVNVDRTLRDGAIAPPGYPRVLIGGPSFSVPTSFSIDGSPEFNGKVVRNLYKLSVVPSGKVLLDRLVASGKTIRFVPPDTDKKEQELIDLFAATPRVSYDPDAMPLTEDASGALSTCPSEVALAHEMLLALDYAEGKTPPSWWEPDPLAPDFNRVEARATGVGSYVGEPLSENVIRREMGLPERARYRARSPGGAAPP